MWRSSYGRAPVMTGKLLWQHRVPCVLLIAFLKIVNWNCYYDIYEGVDVYEWRKKDCFTTSASFISSPLLSFLLFPFLLFTSLLFTSLLFISLPFSSLLFSSLFFPSLLLTFSNASYPIPPSPHDCFHFLLLISQHANCSEDLCGGRYKCEWIPVPPTPRPWSRAAGKISLPCCAQPLHPYSCFCDVMWRDVMVVFHGARIDDRALLYRVTSPLLSPYSSMH